jgi:hypothetical protein
MVGFNVNPIKTYYENEYTFSLLFSIRYSLKN